ncbi:hypothetical protein B9479_003229 [Cryptococcus floricola]|uniref:Uncharacterized protein n=1 Tax=Cryptococcus floricola TaxID=2591691 RepID=A0A5D3B116_9TREE|nr:hypothetical protein B9479_003229 [Cryptococcus floricola]
MAPLRAFTPLKARPVIPYHARPLDQLDSPNSPGNPLISKVRQSEGSFGPSARHVEEDEEDLWGVILLTTFMRRKEDD